MNTDDTPDDELVSAVLDGDADADVRALVAGTPRLAARLAEFRAVRTGLGTSDEGDLGTGADERIAAALAAADDEAEDVTPAGPAVVPVPSRRRWGPAVLAAAAAVLVVVVGGLLVLRDRDDGTTSAAESAPLTTVSPVAGSDSSGVPADGPSSDRSAQESPGPTVPPTSTIAGSGVPDVGAFADLADLTDRVSRSGGGAVPEAAVSAEPGDTTAVPCAASMASRGAVPIGTATVAGRVVVVGRGPDDVVVVLAASDCAPAT
jgi:hypothetical protein